MSLDLYKMYLKERENTELISVEYGFITYKFEREFCYIVDIYIAPHLRKTGLGTKLENKVVVEAKKKGYNKLLGSVDKIANNWLQSKIVLLRRGFKEAWEDGNMIYLVKELS